MKTAGEVIMEVAALIYSNSYDKKTGDHSYNHEGAVDEAMQLYRQMIVTAHREDVDLTAAAFGTMSIRRDDNDLPRITLRQIVVLEDGVRKIIAEAVRYADSPEWAVTFLQHDWLRDVLCSSQFKSGEAIADRVGGGSFYRYETGVVFNSGD
jgi:hypothetical protein